MKKMTLIEMYNEVLVGAGYLPISAISSAGSPEEDMTALYLDRETNKLLSEGWWFNYDEDVTLTLDTNDKIPVPDTLIRIEFPGDDIIERDDFLYSKKDKSDIFTGNIDVVGWQVIAMEDLPYVAQQFVAKAATRKLVAVKAGDVGLLRSAIMDEQTARIELVQAEGQHANHNMLANPSLRGQIRRTPEGLR